MSDAPAFDMSKLVESFLPMIIIFGLQYLKLDYTDPVTLWTLRGVFAASVLAYALICFKIQATIKSKKAELSAISFDYEKTLGAMEKMSAQSEYQQKKANGERAEAPKDTQTITTTAYEYDLGEAKQLLRSGLTSYAVSLGIHMYFGYAPPIVISAVMSLRRLTKLQLFGLHVQNKPAVGELARPFAPEPSPFAGLMGAAGGDAAAPAAAAGKAVKESKKNK